MLDAMIASALKKLLNTHIHFRKRVSVEEQRAQKSDRFLRGRQIAYMIYDHFRVTRAYDTAQDLSDLFNIPSQNDDVQDFDTRWDEAPPAASEIPTEMVLDGLYKSKLQDSVQRQTVLVLYEQENCRNNEQTSYSRWKTSVKLHIDQMMRTRNFRARSEVVERGSVPKSQKKERKHTLSGKWDSVFSGRHTDTVPKETHEVSVMTQRPSGNRGGDQRPKGRSSSPAPNSKGNQTDGEKGDKEEISDKRSHISCKFWHLPVCHNWKSEKGCICGDKCHFRHVEAEGKPSKKSNKGGAIRISCDFEGVCTFGLCISRFLFEKVYST